MDTEKNYAADLGPEFVAAGSKIDRALYDTILAQRERYAERGAALKRAGLLPTYRTPAVDPVKAAIDKARKAAWDAPLTSNERALLGDTTDADLIEDVKTMTRGRNPYLAPAHGPGTVWA
jgi:hypothetical protein